MDFHPLRWIIPNCNNAKTDTTGEKVGNTPSLYRLEKRHSAKRFSDPCQEAMAGYHYIM